MCTFNPASAVQAGGLMYHSQVLIRPGANVTQRKMSIYFVSLFTSQGEYFPVFFMLTLFQDCSSDGPGQPSMQKTHETEDSFKEKEAQDQGSSLCSQVGLSEVRRKHSRMSESSCKACAPDGIERRLKKQHKPPDSKSVFMKTALSGCETRCFSTSHALG